MEVISQTSPVTRSSRRLRITLVGIVLVALIVGAWAWRSQGGESGVTNTRSPGAGAVLRSALDVAEALGVDWS